MKILVTGAAGMLAAEVIPELIRNNHVVFQTDINQRIKEIELLDVTAINNVYHKVKELQPDYIFHLGAETNVDLCQEKPDYAFRVNTLGTENMALASLKYGIPFVYISTSGVFSGEKPSPYTEFDMPSPVNIYGETKLQGEILVKNLLRKYFIIRAGWMIGGWEIDKKFVYKIVQQLKEGRKELKVVADKFGSPTFTKDFARNLITVINTNRYGIYHLANKGTCSRYEIALKIVEFMGLKEKIKVNPIDSSQFPLPAPRARSEMLRNYKLDLLGINTIPHWEDSLKDYLLINKEK